MPIYKIGSFLFKLKLIVWKNLILRQRHKKFTIFEILCPVILFIMLPTLKALTGNKPTRYNITDFEPISINIDDKLNIFYAPNSTEINDIMLKVKGNIKTDLFEGYKTEKEMMNRIAMLAENNMDYMFGVVFDDFNKNTKKLNYRIKFRDSRGEIEYPFPNTFYYNGSSEYLHSGFVCLQKVIDFAYVDYVSNNALSQKTIEITTQLMPQPAHEKDNDPELTETIILSIPFCTFASFLYPHLIRHVIEEKSSGMKELMKMMGLEAWMLWLGWFIYAMFTAIIIMCIITILLKVSFSANAAPVFHSGDGGIIWLFMFLYSVSTVCFYFAISTFFKKPIYGENFGVLIWFITYIIAGIIVENFKKLSQNILNLSQFLPIACVTFAMQVINDFERYGGLHLSNLWTKPVVFTTYPSMGQIMLMLFVDSIILLIITWYVDNIKQGIYGTARKWNFPFTKAYWCSNKIEDDTLNDGLENRPEIEPVGNDLHAGIQIRNLRKKFKSRYAVDGLNLDVYSKQITVLLGHNGAGKTTTMNIITGMLPATSGTVIVDGYDIKTNINKVRESLGLCPQDNVQLADLTVMEHLLFFAMLKGCTRKEAKLESMDYLKRLHLESKADTMVSALSGGMRRKLSLGMALVGKTKVLMLDEPTSGMDPEARREIWDFLLGMRGERTILITTHCMEEADILGDRIAIMHNGQLKCYGTSLFLKKFYGTGYTLSILTMDNWDINRLTDAIQKYVPSATVKNRTTGTIVYSLPTSDTAVLSSLFNNLEAKKNELGIANFGVAITSLEDVFLKVGELADELDNANNRKSSDKGFDKLLLPDNNNYLNGFQKTNNEKMSSRVLQQFIALFMKRVKYSLHKRIFFLIEAMVPIIMCFIVFIISIILINSSQENVNVNLNLRMYTQAQSFYSFDPSIQELAEMYKASVEAQNAKATSTSDVQQSLLNVLEKDELRYERTLVTAAQLNGGSSGLQLNALYGSYPLHGPPISLNLLTNALLKWITADKTYSIQVANNPLLKNETETMHFDSLMNWVTVIPMAFVLMIGFFLAFPQGERLTGVKHLQIMSGVSRPLYWITNYLIDFIVYFIVTVIIVVLLIAFNSGGAFGSAATIKALSAMLFLFGLAALPFAYLFHYRPTPASGIIVFLGIHLWLGLLAAMMLRMLRLALPDKYRLILTTLTYILMLVPNFALCDGMQSFAHKTSTIRACSIENNIDCFEYLSYYHGEDSIAHHLIYLACEVFIYPVVFLLVDTGLPGHWLDQLRDSLFYKNNKNTIDETIDPDVAAERERVTIQINESSRMSSANEREQSIEDILLVCNLRKYFKRFYAVRGLNFGVKKGECFGLLGINGAGKTTTFKILTGDIFPTTGLANLQGSTLHHDKYNYLKNIGYCPQFAALNMRLTTREMLELFASIRGVQKNEVKRHVDNWIEKFDIKIYEHIPCGKLSGGNKRKLNTAIALIGDPPLIMLDEPTSGVDPISRRNLWDILGVLRKSGKSIILASHNMGECEALCDRLGIMVDGQFKCLGSIQYLKQKYGEGFNLMVKLRAATATTSTDTDEPDGESPLLKLKNTIENTFACTIKDEHFGMILYHVTSPNVTLGQLFTFMERLKTKEDIIEDYTVSDASLEQVFLSFVKVEDEISANPTNAIV